MAAPDTAPGYKDAGPAAGDAPLRKTHANAAPRDKTTTNTSDAADDDDDADAPYSSSPPDTAAIAVGDMDLRAQLELEKSRYPGAATWAPDEARLFELLFYRQDLPILPSHWDIDLRGVPISMTNFADAANPPVVYAHGKDFVASTALVRLIELTASIRTTSESGLHHRVPTMLKDGLDRFLAWAAEDGGYSHLRVVPNAIAEVIDTALLEGDITALLQGRMRALARLQRDYLRQDRDPNFWQGITTGAAASNTKTEDDEGGHDDVYADRDSLLLQRYLSPRKDRLFNRTPRRGNGGLRRRRRLGSNAMEDELATTPDAQTSGADAVVPRRRRTFASPVNELDELAQPGGDSCLLSSSPSERTEASRRLQSSPATSPSSPATVQYRRRPPVVYGFFVLNSSIFVLTTDASRGENAYVSFHVETDFMEQGQCVWNALTLAIVACLARDDMRLRVDDFEPLAAEEESDPDA